LQNKTATFELSINPTGTVHPHVVCKYAAYKYQERELQERLSLSVSGSVIRETQGHPNFIGYILGAKPEGSSLATPNLNTGHVFNNLHPSPLCIV
jgi:hypothetical protein